MTEVTVVGCGFMGEYHARAIDDHPSLTLDAVVDVDEKQADRVGTAFGADRILTDFSSAFEATDAAVIATPEPYHAEQAHAALDSGLDLLLEKPITDDLAEAKKLTDRIDDTSLVTGVSFVLRYDPAYAEVHRLSKNGELGEIVSARAMRGITSEESRRVGPRGHPNFYMSVHDIDAILTGIDASVETVTANERYGELADIGVPDTVQALLTFTNGTTAVVEGHGVLPNDVPGGIVAAFELVGTHGTATTRTPGNTLEVTTGSYDRPDTRHWPVVNGEMDGAVRRQIDRFAKAIAGDREMEATVADGYRAQLVGEAIREAAETNGPVRVENLERSIDNH